jgi:hypothetical protein
MSVNGAQCDAIGPDGFTRSLNWQPGQAHGAVSFFLLTGRKQEGSSAR